MLRCQPLPLQPTAESPSGETGTLPAAKSAMSSSHASSPDGVSVTRVSSQSQSPGNWNSQYAKRRRKRLLAQRGLGPLGLQVLSGPGHHTLQVSKAEVSETGKEAMARGLSSQFRSSPVHGQELAKAASSRQSFLTPHLSLRVA